MPISNYLEALRAKVGNALVLVPSVTGIVYDAERRILLVKNADTDVWVAPGGSMEPNELPADTLVREMWEETGLVVEPVRVLGVYGGPEFQVSSPNGDEAAYVMTVFECRVLAGKPRADGIETLHAVYFAQPEVEKLAISRWLKVILTDIFLKQEKTCFEPSSWQPPESSDADFLER